MSQSTEVKPTLPEHMDGGSCPFCGSGDLEAEHGECDANYYSQAVNCLDCEARWFENYYLNTFTVGDDREVLHTGEYNRQQAEQQMYDALQAIAPLRDNGLLEELWSLCRRTGEHCLAERITAWSNPTRALMAQREAKGV
jgi:hypothetical protein